MLGWILRLLQPAPRLEYYPDSIAMNQKGVERGLRRALQQRHTQDSIILVVCHFPETFFETQDLLDQWEINYEIPTPPIRPQQITTMDEVQSKPKILLVLSEMLDIDTGLSSSNPKQTIAVMVVERYPLTTQDRRIETFCRQLPHPVKLGYFISLDHAAIAPLLGHWIEDILKLWGMNDVDLITSELVTRRLNRARSWLDKEVDSESPCDSALDWWNQHGGNTRYAKAFENYLAKTTKAKP